MNTKTAEHGRRRSECSDFNYLFSVGPVQALNICHEIVNKKSRLRHSSCAGKKRCAKKCPLDDGGRSNVPAANPFSVGPVQALNVCHEIVNKTFRFGDSSCTSTANKKTSPDRCAGHSDMKRLVSAGPVQALDISHETVNNALFFWDSLSFTAAKKRPDRYDDSESSDTNSPSVGPVRDPNVRHVRKKRTANDNERSTKKRPGSSNANDLLSISPVQVLDVCHEIVNKTRRSYAVQERLTKRRLGRHDDAMNLFSVGAVRALDICHEVVNKEFHFRDCSRAAEECSETSCLDGYNSSESSDRDVSTIITDFGSPLTADSEVSTDSVPTPKKDQPIMIPPMSATQNSTDEIYFSLLHHPECADSLNNSATHQSQDDNNSVQITKNEVETSNDEPLPTANVRPNESFDLDNNSNGSLVNKLFVDQTNLLSNMSSKYVMLSSSASPRGLSKTKSAHLSDQNKNVPDNSTTTTKPKRSLRSAINKHSRIVPERNAKRDIKLTATEKDKSTNGKSIKKGEKKLRHCRRPFTTKDFDVFDEPKTTSLETRFSVCDNDNVHNFIDYSRRAIKFQPAIVAHRTTLDENKKQEILIRWFPPEILDDEWIAYDEKTILSEFERHVPMMSMNAANRDVITNLFGNIFLPSIRHLKL